MTQDHEVLIEVVESIADVPADQWNACANPEPENYNPFISHAFLKTLEDCKAVHHSTGWQPQHLILREADSCVTACMPLYAKSHSKGEYVFDYGWAEAFQQAGGQYYPKLVSAVPFTPVPGRRCLVKPGINAEAREKYILSGAIELAGRYQVSSLHINFLSEAEWEHCAKVGFLKRTDQQFHWQNQGYGAFEDFLAGLASRKRKAMRKERTQATADNINIEQVTGKDITEAHWDAIYEFYIDTSSRKWGQPYLNRNFFSLLGAAMAERCLLVMAKRNDRYIAGALHMIGGDCLYGRYWGAIETHSFLHFEICYYQAIDYAIQHNLRRVEAGAQGEHKLTRGYMPVPTFSAHYIAHPRFSKAIEAYLEGERAHVKRSREMLAGYGPYRKAANEVE